MLEFNWPDTGTISSRILAALQHKPTIALLEDSIQLQLDISLIRFEPLSVVEFSVYTPYCYIAYVEELFWFCFIIEDSDAECQK